MSKDFPHPAPRATLPHKGGGEEEASRASTTSFPSPLVGEGGGARSATPGGGSLEARARHMRKNPTEAEAKLWRALRDHRFSGFKFRRQEPIGNYIADFVCFRPRIIVEADGTQHQGSSYDALRDRWFASQGFTVVRLWNNDVLANLEGALDAIAEALRTHPVGAAPSERGKSAKTYWMEQE